MHQYVNSHAYPSWACKRWTQGQASQCGPAAEHRTEAAAGAAVLKPQQLNQVHTKQNHNAKHTESSPAPPHNSITHAPGSASRSTRGSDSCHAVHSLDPCQLAAGWPHIRSSGRAGAAAVCCPSKHPGHPSSRPGRPADAPHQHGQHTDNVHSPTTCAHNRVCKHKIPRTKDTPGAGHNKTTHPWCLLQSPLCRSLAETPHPVPFPAFHKAL